METKLLQECHFSLEKCRDSEKSIFRTYLSSVQYNVVGYAMLSTHCERYRIDPKGQFSPKPEYKASDFRSLARMKNLKQEKSEALGENPLRCTELKANGQQNSMGLNGNMEIQADMNTPPWLTIFPKRSEEVVMEPFNYISNIAATGNKIRKHVVECLNIWYKVPEDRLKIIMAVSDLLRNSLVMMDDIQDGTPVRKGVPATHMVFGIAQAINTENMLLVKSYRELQKLSPEGIKLYLEELCDLYTGQGHDLHAIFKAECPTVSELLRTIDGKAGRILTTISVLMRTEATINRDLEVEELLIFAGRYVQVWDDYLDVLSNDCASDLDEGSFSLPIIYAMDRPGPESAQLRSLFKIRAQQGAFSKQQKELIMKILKESKSDKFALQILGDLEEHIEKLLQAIEAKAPKEGKNWMFRAIIAGMKARL
ncbi:hypothetical protein TWF106_006863 [Orbilia oligospora]|uniref:Uncharacterized protein n=1 Tax=Orbilia oligospora TaxID=2813651 RepID=A0A7C8QSJ7_ORBOL|nr:hypothetical protein TWF106_006863 [Orbilia oligospora]